jgi:hypothetical protein
MQPSTSSRSKKLGLRPVAEVVTPLGQLIRF